MSEYTGPRVRAMRPGPNGPYAVVARADEAKAKGWEVLDGPPAGDTNDEGPAEVDLAELGITEVGGGWYELPNGDKVQGKDEAIAEAQALEG